MSDSNDAVEPVGLNMSLDELIHVSKPHQSKQQNKDPNNNSSVKNYAIKHCFECMQQGIRTSFPNQQMLNEHKTLEHIRHCFDCMKSGIRTSFPNKLALDDHKLSVHGIISKRKDESSLSIIVNYSWNGEGTDDENMIVEHLGQTLLKISSCGDIEINGGDIQRNSTHFTILNTCLNLLNYKVSCENNNVNGIWIISNKSSWSKPLEDSLM
jgi:hypothetical protein